jgi:hypothetical protein
LGQLDHNAHGGRGALLTITRLGTESTARTIDDLTSRQFVFDPHQVRNSVHSYRLTYRTVDAAGRPTTASGLFVLPDNGNHDPQVITYLPAPVRQGRGTPSGHAGSGKDRGRRTGPATAAERARELVLPGGVMAKGLRRALANSGPQVPVRAALGLPDADPGANNGTAIPGQRSVRGRSPTSNRALAAARGR